LNHIDRPENSSSLKRLYYATVMKRSCHRAARILTVSEFTRRRIVEWSGVAPENVVNVRCGVGAEFHPEVEEYPLPFPYLLCVSNRKRHKNEFRTVEAFAQAHVDVEIRLVFTGNPTQELLDCIERCGVTERVQFVGLVPDAELPSLYRSAAALVFASLYEGFGLPVLEAMACGTPVVTSNTGALAEISGNAALLVDPESVPEISLGIDRILSDDSLRSKLRISGLERAAGYSWETTTASVHRVLHDVEAKAHGKV
jgi:glycosyltransferase involved in cell wall biosynthesis